MARKALRVSLIIKILFVNAVFAKINASLIAWVSTVKKFKDTGFRSISVNMVKILESDVKISLKFAMMILCGVLFFLKLRSCVLILGDLCQKGVALKGEKVSVLIRQFELLFITYSLMMYVSVIFSCFFDVLELGEKVNICDDIL